MRRAPAFIVVAFALSACSEFLSGPRLAIDPADLGSALNTVPLGFSEVTSSYAGDGGERPSLWLPGAHPGRFGGGLMGGGMHDAFIGGVSLGRGFGHHGPFGGGLACSGGTFSASTGRVTCPTETRDGLTITRSAAYTNTAGQVQQAFDTLTTNSVNVQMGVTGTVSYTRDSTSGHRGPGPRHVGRIVGDTTTILTANTTVNNRSDRTVSGLAQGSTQRTVNATSAGQESTTGTSSRGNFTASRGAADTTRGLLLPVSTSGSPAYPTAGTVIRVMRATVQYSGQAATTTTRREVVTYDGSNTAKVVITKDGVTQNCTIPLPRGRPTCQ
jgi:hypothetical protein